MTYRLLSDASQMARWLSSTRDQATGMPTSIQAGLVQTRTLVPSPTLGFFYFAAQAPPTSNLPRPTVFSASSSISFPGSAPEVVIRRIGIVAAPICKHGARQKIDVTRRGPKSAQDLARII